MLTLNLGTLGVTEEALTNAILSELGITKEQAIRQLATRLGVSLEQPASTIRNGERVSTDRGEAIAQTITQEELSTLRRAAEITGRLFATA